MLDLRILNATIVSQGAVAPGDIGIEGAVIAEVGEPGSLGPARVEVDATGFHAMPGAIDVHFHCRAPSHPQRGDFRSETQAAAAGGVTTIFEMPISDPACSTPAVFHNRRQLATGEAYVNFALYAGAATPDPRLVQEMAELGAIAFKLFTIAPPAGRETEFEGLWATEDSTIYRALAAVAETRLPCVVHAESHSLLAYFESLPFDNGIPLRPPVTEAAAISSVAALAKDAGARVHVAHVSSRAALDAVRGALAMGTVITAETCPQYLVLDGSTVARFGALAKIAPPLRTPADRAALWEALRDGTLTLVASDHSPFLREEKLGVEYASAPQGLPTVEIMLPVLLDAAAAGALPLAAAVDLVTTAPARLFGLEGRKGLIAEGADADVTLFALGAPYHPDARSFFTRAAECAVVYEPLSLRARVVSTIVNGRVAFERGAIVGEPNGRFAQGRASAALEPEPV